MRITTKIEGKSWIKIINYCVLMASHKRNWGRWKTLLKFDGIVCLLNVYVWLKMFGKDFWWIYGLHVVCVFGKCCECEFMWLWMLNTHGLMSMS
jgi:hypothetical protein